ncbi:MAG: bifunctional adenosylcobinamide kinase/adenosylcobinamide-phosphate guanylyltransferase [Lachnospiraceae bacterium]
MKIFLSGGCKNGKSAYAEELAVALSKQHHVPLYYLATMKPVDDEDYARIEKHRESRKDSGFTTIEVNRNIHMLPPHTDSNGSYLLDSATALLVNEMFLPDGSTNLHAGDLVAGHIEALLSTHPNMVIVSDYLYSDAIEYDDFTDAYRRELATIDKACAKLCDVVIEVSFSNLIVYKGKDLLL